MSFVVTVYINEAIPLLHFAGARADDINGAPVGIAHNVYSIPQSVPQSHQVLAEIVNAVIIVNDTVFVWLIDLSQTILPNKERNLIAVIQFIQRKAQPQRVNLPSPRRCFQVGVRCPLIAAGIARERCSIFMGGGAVVAEAEIISSVLPHHFFVPRFHLHMNIFFVPNVRHVVGVIAANHDIAVQQRAAAQLHSFKHIFRAAAVRVNVAQIKHAADFGIRNDLMTQLDGQRICNKHIVARLIYDLLMVLTFLEEDTASRTGHSAHIVDFIEGQPVFDFARIATEHGFAILGKEANQLAAAPAAILLDQISRGLIMA